MLMMTIRLVLDNGYMLSRYGIVRIMIVRYKSREEIERVEI